MWRNAIPHVTRTHRAIAADMIGVGQSDKPDLAYSYGDHAAHLHGAMDARDPQDATLVRHDWEGALGFDDAMKNPGRIRAIAFMETVAPPELPFANYNAMGPFGQLFKAWRTPGVGEEMILECNMFINEILAKQAVLTPLSADVIAHYNSYYPDAASRTPLLAWPGQVPIGGEPAVTTALSHRIAAFLIARDLPKLTFHVTPGALAPPAAVEWMKSAVPTLKAIHLGPGAHFIQETIQTRLGSAFPTGLQRSEKEENHAQCDAKIPDPRPHCRGLERLGRFLPIWPDSTRT